MWSWGFSLLRLSGHASEQWHLTSGEEARLLLNFMGSSLLLKLKKKDKLQVGNMRHIICEWGPNLFIKYIHINIYKCMYVYVCMCTYIHMYVYIYVYKCYICTYICYYFHKLVSQDYRGTEKLLET